MYGTQTIRYSAHFTQTITYSSQAIRYSAQTIKYNIQTSICNTQTIICNTQTIIYITETIKQINLMFATLTKVAISIKNRILESLVKCGLISKVT